MKSALWLAAVAGLAVTTAAAQTTYDGNGQVPEQFRLSGKPAEKLHDYISINLATAEKLAAACEAIARRDTLVQRHSMLQSAIKATQEEPERYSMREIKWKATLPVSKLHRSHSDSKYLNSFSMNSTSLV